MIIKQQGRYHYTRWLILMAFCLFLTNILSLKAEDNPKIDSLLHVLEKEKIDTNRVNLLISVGAEYSAFDIELALEYTEKAIESASNWDFKKGLADAINQKGNIYYNQGNYPLAKENYEQALDIYIEIDKKSVIGDCYFYIAAIELSFGNYDDAIVSFGESYKYYNEVKDTANMAYTIRYEGIAYNYKGNYDLAIERYFDALKLYELINNENGIASCYNSLGIANYDLKNFDKSVEYILKSIEIKEKLGNLGGAANSYLNIGVIKKDQGDYDASIKYTKEALEIFEDIDSKQGLSACYTNIGVAYSETGRYTEANRYYYKALKIDNELNDQGGLAILNNNIANLHYFIADSLLKKHSKIHKYKIQKHLDSALMFGKKSLEISKELGSFSYESSNAKLLMESYAKLNQYKKAFEYAKIFITANDSMFSEEKTNAIQEMETKYETEKKQQQIELQETQLIAKEAKIKQQVIYRNALILGLTAGIIIIFLVAYAYVQKKKDNELIRQKNAIITEANEELHQLNEEILTQKEEIESQRDHVMAQKQEITDSINYAQRIQSAILPPDAYIDEILPENFILYKPRDIVSGDFYWIKQINEFTIIAAVDCTGHGVPGAFMSMLGISFINEIVQRREITQANQVLEELRNQIKESLRQHGEEHETRDGMDVALCALHSKKRTVQYAGAFNPLYIIRGNKSAPELIEYKADRMPVGFHYGKYKSFTNHEIQLEPGDTLYMFSDGYVDQIGGEKNKKFMIKNFKKLLLEINNEPLIRQKEILNQTLEDWMLGYPQVDDILIIGIRV